VVQGGQQRLDHSVPCPCYGTGEGCLQGRVRPKDQGEDEWNGGGAGGSKGLRHPVPWTGAGTGEGAKEVGDGRDAEGAESPRRIAAHHRIFTGENSDQARIILRLSQTLDICSKLVKEYHITVSVECVPESPNGSLSFQYILIGNQYIPFCA
jgi:hypothetical protein